MRSTLCFSRSWSRTNCRPTISWVCQSKATSPKRCWSFSMPRAALAASFRQVHLRTLHAVGLVEGDHQGDLAALLLDFEVKRQDALKRRVPVALLAEGLLARHEEESAPLLIDPVDQGALGRFGEAVGGDVAEHDGVVAGKRRRRQDRPARGGPGDRQALSLKPVAAGRGEWSGGASSRTRCAGSTRRAPRQSAPL